MYLFRKPRRVGTGSMRRKSLLLNDSAQAGMTAKRDASNLYAGVN